MKTIATIKGGIIQSPGGTTAASGSLPNAARMNDAAIASNMSTLISELERRDTLVREPLTSFTYLRDIPIKSGGGWVDTISALNTDYGVSGGSDDALISASGSNSPRVIQANFDKDTFRAFVFEAILRIKYIDMQRGNIVGRPLESLLNTSLRMAYDKYLDSNTYIGRERYGTPGIVNNPDVTAAPVSTGASGSTEFTKKDADEILFDINNLISETHEQAEHDLTALPNHLIMPYAQFNYIATTKVTPLADKTILTFIHENNISTQNGGGLVIGATAYCKGAGVGGTDRMVCYVHNDRFIAMEELVPLSRTMTQPNVDAVAYDSLYMANTSQVEFFYNQTIRYADGI